MSTCYPLKYIMDNPILIVANCMGKSIRKQRVKETVSINVDPEEMPHSVMSLQDLRCHETCGCFAKTQVSPNINSL